MELNFNISVKPSNVVRIDLKGRLLSEEKTADLIAAFDLQIASNRNKFIINIEGLEYVNSVGLNSFIRLLTKARKNDGEVAIFGANPRLEELIILTKLNTVFDIFKTEDEALEAINE